MFELESKFVLRPSQGGFRKRLCCIDQVSKLESDIRLALSEKKILVAVFIDLEKAFDSVWHLGLVYKLSRLGIKGKMLAWIKEYLQGRKYKVFFEGEYSSEKPIYSGVPQGAILSPLLFNVMMCDLPLENGVSSTEYADDIAFSFASSDPLEVQEKMNKQMDIFYKWCREWGLSINITKTKAMYFTNRRLVPPDIELSNVPLEYVPTYRYLGLLLDSPKLTWKNHIEFLKDSSAQRVNILKSVSAHHWGADRKMLLNLYFSLIRSRFDYGCQVYINSAFTNLSKLDKIQNNCLRIALGVPKTSPISSLEVESGVYPLNFRRQFLLLKYFCRLNELPPNLEISLSLSYINRKFQNKQWTMKNCPPPLPIRAAMLFEKLGIIPPSYYPAPLISPIPPNFNIENFIFTEFTTFLVRDISNDLAKTLFASIQEKYAGFVPIFTDGSKIMNPEVSCTSGVVIQKEGNTEMINFRLNPDFSVMACELYAIYQALEYIQIGEDHHKKFVIYTDSLSSLTAIKNPHVKSYVSLIFKIQGQIIRLAGTGYHVILQYIPGHKDIQGNELADLAAAAAHSNDILDVRVAKEDKLRNIKKAVLSLWQASWERLVDFTQKGRHIKLIKPNANPWSWACHRNRAAETVFSKIKNRTCQLWIPFI